MPRQKTTKRLQHLANNFSTTSDVEEEEVLTADQPLGWGSSRKNYYAEDQSASEAEGEDADLMLQEALQAQKAQLSLFKESDLPDIVTIKEDSNCDGEDKNDLLNDSSKDDQDLHQIEDETLLLQIEQNIQETLLCISEKNPILPIEGGSSLIQAKNALQSNYALNCAFLLLLKSQGRPIEGHPVIKHLVQVRLLLEKIRPLEQQQHEVSIAIGQSSSLGRSQSSSFKANLEDLASAAATEEETNSFVDSSISKSSATYKAPKITPMHFDDEGQKASSTTNAAGKKTSKHRISREMLEDLRGEMGDLPEERRDYTSNSLLGENEDHLFVRRGQKHGENGKKRRSSGGGGHSVLTNELHELNELSGKMSTKKHKGKGDKKHSKRKRSE